MQGWKLDFFSFSWLVTKYFHLPRKQITVQQILSYERESKILYSTVKILPDIWAGYTSYLPAES